MADDPSSISAPATATEQKTGEIGTTGGFAAVCSAAETRRASGVNIADTSTAASSSTVSSSSLAMSSDQDEKPRHEGLQVQASVGNGSESRGPHVDRQDALSKKRKTIIVCALCLCVLMAAMDQTIVTTAIPVIVDNFDSPSGYTWIGTAYLLLACAFLPSWGKFSDIFGRKPVLLIACTIFLVGSILCAAAQNIVTIIGGRAVQGVGAGGLVGLVNVTISDLVAVRERGLYLAFIGFTWAFASAIGPILGGVFTQYVTWRLCFWINVPLTVIAMTALFFLLHLHSPRVTVIEGLKRVDWLGTILIVLGTVLFLLGLEFGGISHPWNSAIVICFITFGAGIMAAFMVVEWKFAKLPLMPLRLFTHRTNIASYLTGFFHGFVFIGGCYFLPLYFQAVRGSSVLMSGICILPYVLPLSFASAISGQFISKTGSYREVIWGGVALMALGAGLLSNLDRTSNWAKIIIYQLIAGAGAGPLFQGPLIAIHSVIEQEDVGTATVTFGFIRNLATALGISLGLVVFQNTMKQQAELLGSVLPVDIIQVISGNTATANVPFINRLPTTTAILVRDAYAKGLQSIWYFFLACSTAALLSSLALGKHHLSTVVQSTQPARKRRVRDVEAATQ